MELNKWIQRKGENTYYRVREWDHKFHIKKCPLNKETCMGFECMLWVSTFTGDPNTTMPPTKLENCSTGVCGLMRLS